MKLNKKIIPHRPSRGLPRGAVRCGEDSKSTIRLFIPQASTDISATVHQGLPVFCEETKSSRRLITLRASTVRKITVTHKPRGHTSDNILRDVKLRDKVIDSCDTFYERNTNCQMCCIMSDAQEFFTSSVSGRKYPIILGDLNFLDCTSSNVVYLITCKHCKFQYVGETRQRFATRMSIHKSYIRSKHNTLIAQHFNGPCTPEHFSAQQIEKIPGGGLKTSRVRHSSDFSRNREIFLSTEI
jgi:GIY-YIG catalytic domain